jgi:hypothetical protein
VRHLIIRLAVVGGLVAAVVVLPAAAASAHAEFEEGPYTFAVGFGTEPAYVGIPNSAEVIIHVTKSDKGVDTAADTVNATVAYGSAQPHQVTLEGNFDGDSGGSPGDYRGAFVPTQAGKYTMHVFGKVGNTKVDKSFTSSPTTFATVVDPSTIEYPTKIPTATELNAKVDRELPRIQAQATSAANDAASSAKTLAVVGIIVGVVALVLGGVALARKRS